MRKLGSYLLGLILVAAAVAAVLVAAKASKSHDDKISNSPESSEATTPQTKKACNIFTLADAKLLLGAAAKGGQNPAIDSSEDLNVTTCTYTQDQGANAPVSGRQSATLLVRAPISGRGTNSNQNEFGPLKPDSVQDVAGYGSSAYWDAEHGQLNILKDSIWYVLSNGPAAPADRTLDQARQMADILIHKM